MRNCAGDCLGWIRWCCRWSVRRGRQRGREDFRRRAGVSRRKGQGCRPGSKVLAQRLLAILDVDCKDSQGGGMVLAGDDGSLQHFVGVRRRSRGRTVRVLRPLLLQVSVVHGWGGPMVCPVWVRWVVVGVLLFLMWGLPSVVVVVLVVNALDGFLRLGFGCW